MTAIPEIPEVRQRVSPLSVEEYHRLGEFNENGRRTELIRSILIPVIECGSVPGVRLPLSKLFA